MTATLKLDHVIGGYRFVAGFGRERTNEDGLGLRDRGSHVVHPVGSGLLIECAVLISLFF